VANRLLSAIRENPIETTKGLLPVTVSIGISSGALNDSLDERRMMSDADQALYRAKRTGKDRVETLRATEKMDLSAAPDHLN
jgi:diguanylate cyclase (GGDEF)-like protein